MHCGLMQPVGISNVFQKPLTIPLYSPNGSPLGLCKKILKESKVEVSGLTHHSGRRVNIVLWRYFYHLLRRKLSILTKLPSLAAPEVVKFITCGAATASDENSAKMIFLFHNFRCYKRLKFRQNGISVSPNYCTAVYIVSSCGRHAGYFWWT